MAIPTTPTPARPIDDAIIETGWGTWAHDELASHPIVQTMNFGLTYASGAANRSIPYLEAYPAGWSVVIVGFAPGLVTGNTAADKFGFSTPGLASVGIRSSLGSYSGTSAGWYVTVAGFPPGVTVQLWRFGGVAPTVLAGVVEAEDVQED